MAVPLSVLDLVPAASGVSAGDAVRNALDLARRTEAAGYHRYWIAEHHLNPGVMGASPPIVITMVAGATERIRVGSGAVLLGHQTPLAVVEQFGLIDALYPGRIDLGLGRSGARRTQSRLAGSAEPWSEQRAQRRRDRLDALAPHRPVVDGRVVIPPKFAPGALLKSPRFALQARLLQQPGAMAPEFTEQLGDILTMLRGPYRDEAGTEVRAEPASNGRLEVWILGSSGGESAQLAGSLALPFAANYHVSPGTLMEAVAGYRDAFRPSAGRAAPCLMVSADVVVAPTDAEAERLASGYGLWVRSIRTAAGAIPYPSPEEAAAHPWTDDDRRLVADRVATQFVGSPERVVDDLRVLVAETGADELIVTTITHDHADRVRSYELLAETWAEAW